MKSDKPWTDRMHPIAFWAMLGAFLAFGLRILIGILI